MCPDLPVQPPQRDGIVEQVELATLEYVWWWNHERLHGELDMRTPIEVEQAYYAETETLLSPTG